MEKRNINIENEIQEILNSVTQESEVKPSPFFTTKVMGKIDSMDAQDTPVFNWGYLVKPGIAALIVVNLLNFWLLNTTSSSSNTSQTEVEDLWADYSYNITSTAASYDEYLASNQNNGGY